MILFDLIFPLLDFSSFLKRQTCMKVEWCIFCLTAGCGKKMHLWWITPSPLCSCRLTDAPCRYIPADVPSALWKSVRTGSVSWWRSRLTRWWRSFSGFSGGLSFNFILSALCRSKSHKHKVPHVVPSPSVSICQQRECRRTDRLLFLQVFPFLLQLPCWFLTLRTKI